MAAGLLGATAGATAGSAATATASRAFARICFPAEVWSAPDHERPCYRVSRPYEDGSGELMIRADTIRTRCAIPNVHEEPTRFALQCVSRGG
jgi:hypothetical protein